MVIGIFICLLAFIVIFRIVVIGHLELRGSLKLREQELVNTSRSNENHVAGEGVL